MIRRILHRLFGDPRGSALLETRQELMRRRASVLYLESRLKSAERTIDQAGRSLSAACREASRERRLPIGALHNTLEILKGYEF